MLERNTKISIIIVHYHIKKELYGCIKSIRKAEINLPYEIIIVDNDEKKTIELKLKKIFPEVKYIKALGNIGFGAGNNLGSRYAKGEFLFFLNPDTKIFRGTIERLVELLEKNKNAAIAAPLLLDKNNKPYPLQGTKDLTPLNGIVTLSFLNKLFPNNPISKKYWLLDWDKKNVNDVDVIPGTAFVIRREIFEKLSGFDERFFLYFEESDLCKRVRNLGFKIYIYPSAKVYHAWGASTRFRKDINKIFSDSRFLYFRKHYGWLSVLMIQAMTSFNKVHISLGFIILIAVILRLNRLSELMPFIGDQGWFYLSARDMVLTGNVPLVGITSSHLWLHQGPLWTYMLGIMFLLFRFNPYIPGYFTALAGVVTVFFIYKVGKEMFSERVGLIAAILLTTLPLAIIHTRLPYHTSLAPLFTTFFIYLLYKWINGNVKVVPWIVTVLAILYHQELATLVLWFVFLSFIFFGLWKRKAWAKEVFKKQVILPSLLGFTVVMFPILIYDISHGFHQTIIYVLWVPYRVLRVIYNLYTQTSSTGSNGPFGQFLLLYAQRFFFLPNGFIAIIAFLASLLIFLFRAERNHSNKAIITLLTCFAISFGGFLVNQTPSEAYLVIFFPMIALIMACAFDLFMQFSRLRLLSIGILLSFVAINSYSLVKNNYLMGIPVGYGPTMSDRVRTAENIIALANGRKFNLYGKGPGSQFESYTMNYEYLLWWLGNPPSHKLQTLVFIVDDSTGRVVLTQNRRKL